MYRLLLVTLLSAVLLNTGGNCQRAQYRVTVENGERVLEWYCPSERVLLLYDETHWCFEKCADCPNGYCHENECICFPGMRRDRAGVCEKICKDCENGWCSSVSKCECNEGFTLSQGRCVPQNRYQSNMWRKEEQGHSSMGLSPRSALELSSELAIPQFYLEVSSGYHTHPLLGSISISNYFTHKRPWSFYSPAPLDRRYLAQWPHGQSHPCYPQHSPPIFPEFSVQYPPTYPNYPPQQLPVYPQPNPENPSQPLPQPTPQPPSEFPAQQNPVRPNQFPSESPSQWNPQTSRPPLQPESRPQLNPQPPSELPSESFSGFNPSPAGRPDPPYPFEKDDPQFSSEGQPQPESCQTDYLWDPEAGACVRYESAKLPKIDPRISYYLTRT